MPHSREIPFLPLLLGVLRATSANLPAGDRASCGSSFASTDESQTRVVRASTKPCSRPCLIHRLTVERHTVRSPAALVAETSVSSMSLVGQLSLVVCMNVGDFVSPRKHEGLSGPRNKR